MQLKGKKITIVGLGISGVASARFLNRLGAKVLVTDMAGRDNFGETPDRLERMGVTLRLGSHDETDFTTADLVVISPGVPHTIPPVKKAVEHQVKVVGEFEMASWFIDEPIAAVTGTNGKTTTTKILGRMLADSNKKVFVGGNIGNPLTAYVEKGEKADVVVAEVSSFQLDTISQFKPDVAVVLNITDDHLDRYPDFDAYAKSKWRIFENQTPDNTAVINGNDPVIERLFNALPLSSNVCFFPKKKGGRYAQIDNTTLTIASKGESPTVFDLSRSALKGPHNMENIAAAALAALAAGGTRDGIQGAIDGFTGLPHRMEPAGEKDGVAFINDSKATNTDAVKRALECFEKPVALIMGGCSKDSDFSTLIPHVKKHVKTLVCMGETKDEIITALKGAPSKGIIEAKNMEDAVLKAFLSCRPGEFVVLAPACASFDMFDSYGHRGEVFKQIVKELK